jgi:hypothetical protein
MMMSYILAAGLILGLNTAAAPAAEIKHSTRLDHHSGSVDVRYRGAVAVSHRQVGTAAPAGKPTTLRCLWSANVIVDRQAQATSGAMMTRTIARDGIASGSRAGWCGTQRSAIAKEVAARVQDLNRHIVAVAREDHDVLRAELDRLHGVTRAG